MNETKKFKRKNCPQYYSLRARKPKPAEIKAIFHNSCPNTYIKIMIPLNKLQALISYKAFEYTSSS